MNALHIFSGECDYGPIGLDVGEKDWHDRPLHTGDIVMLAHGDYIDTDAETWRTDPFLTAVLVDRETGKPFAMGIKDCGFADPEWRIEIVKKFSEVVHGERWPAWGFNYRRNTTGAAS
ncbi:hypothetical protein J2X90_000731 [Variovorax paradoxus]|uniref:hypothetical protein n=1 Tax=Variovorax paradoxus TaxID=34073 RepID=UPI00278A5204|nr:hypothetical protein [Variovorax paradoxus]MDQ0022945.1 hypothetical protein [Variovorax paradoxus]